MNLWPGCSFFLPSCVSVVYCNNNALLLQNPTAHLDLPHGTSFGNGGVPLFCCSVAYLVIKWSQSTKTTQIYSTELDKHNKKNSLEKYGSVRCYIQIIYYFLCEVNQFESISVTALLAVSYLSPVKDLSFSAVNWLRRVPGNIAEGSVSIVNITQQFRRENINFHQIW